MTSPATAAAEGEQQDDGEGGHDPHGGGSVFLLTDYGHTDEFAGVVRAVVRRDAPGAAVVDLTHDVTAFDVRAGALALLRCVPHLGRGVVLAVVDPGVGTTRRSVAVSVAGAEGSDGPAYLVGPDNGLLPWAADALGGAQAAVALSGRAGRGARAAGTDRGARAAGTDRGASGSGATFDGRDVYAPAAARLWSGAPLDLVGTAIDPASLVRLEPPLLSVRPGEVRTEAQWIDRFGNVQLSARPADTVAAGLGPEVEVDVDGVPRRARAVAAFADLDPGGLGVLVDANGHLSLVCDRRAAATVLRVRPGDVVTVRDPARPRGPS